MNTQSEMRSTGYRIGAVAKLTGISPDALRVWERRYAVVKTGGTSSGGRLYSDDDIARLRLMKQLVDAGDSIGTIATLTHEELEARIAQVCMANCNSSCNRELEQTAAMLFPHVAV